MVAQWLTTIAAGLVVAATASTGPLYLVDTSHVPHVRLSWTTTEGDRVQLEADRPYASSYDRTPLNDNVDCFVAVGGTRIDKGCGHPDGIVVRVGFYKHNKDELFFKGLGGDGALDIELTNVLANRPGRPIEHTALQHLQYTREDVAACGLGREGQDQFNTLDPREKLLGQLTESNSRFGVLDGDTEEGHGKVEFIHQDDDTWTMRAHIPYMLLRHASDPWVRPTPGLFLEPYHFHIEFEMLPEGSEPLPFEKPKADTSPGKADSGT